MIELFVLGENKLIELNKTWITTIPEFHRIVARDKGAPGISGRNKKIAISQLSYIYHTEDPTSIFESYPMAERKREVAQMLGLVPEDIDSDQDMVVAIDRYRQMVEKKYSTIGILRTLRKTLAGLEAYFDEIDYSERTTGGSMVFDPIKVQKAMQELLITRRAIVQMEHEFRNEISGALAQGKTEKGETEDVDNQYNDKDIFDEIKERLEIPEEDELEDTYL